MNNTVKEQEVNEKAIVMYSPYSDLKEFPGADNGGRIVWYKKPKDNQDTDYSKAILNYDCLNETEKANARSWVDGLFTKRQLKGLANRISAYGPLKAWGNTLPVNGCWFNESRHLLSKDTLMRHLENPYTHDNVILLNRLPRGKKLAYQVYGVLRAFDAIKVEPQEDCESNPRQPFTDILNKVVTIPVTRLRGLVLTQWKRLTNQEEGLLV